MYLLIFFFKFQATSFAEGNVLWESIAEKFKESDANIQGATVRKRIVKLLDAYEEEKNKSRSTGIEEESDEQQTLLGELSVLRKEEKERAAWRKEEKEKTALLKKEKEQKEMRDTLQLLRLVQADNPFQVFLYYTKILNSSQTHVKDQHTKFKIFKSQSGNEILIRLVGLECLIGSTALFDWLIDWLICAWIISQSIDWLIAFHIGLGIASILGREFHRSPRGLGRNRRKSPRHWSGSSRSGCAEESNETAGCSRAGGEQSANISGNGGGKRGVSDLAAGIGQIARGCEGEGGPAQGGEGAGRASGQGGRVGLGCTQRRHQSGQGSRRAKKGSFRFVFRLLQRESTRDFSTSWDAFVERAWHGSNNREGWLADPPSASAKTFEN